MTPAGHFAHLRELLRQLGVDLEVTARACDHGFKVNTSVAINQSIRRHTRLCEALDVAEAEVLQREIFN